MPTLPDDLVEEVFLRLPPDEPACLVRASLASTLWHGRLTGARLRGRYRDFHGAPRMLGFLPYDGQPEEQQPVLRFVSTTGFAPDDAWGEGDYACLDCRHGRVLLVDQDATNSLLVWDPITGRRTNLEAPKGDGFEPSMIASSWATVLCAATGCGHRACHDQGPFRVVFFAITTLNGAHCAVYSPHTGAGWSDPCPALHLGNYAFLVPVPPVVIKDAIYLTHTRGMDRRIAGILKYDLGSNCLSLIDAPMPTAGAAVLGSCILMAMEDGSLGFAQVDRLTLYLWSRTRQMGLLSWTQQPKVIHLSNLLPIQNPNKRLRLIGSMEGSDIIFITTDLGIYEINLSTLRWNKIWKRQKFRTLIPYMSFHNPQERASPCDAAH